jgi:hypothetical protein
MKKKMYRKYSSLKDLLMKIMESYRQPLYFGNTTPLVLW